MHKILWPIQKIRNSFFRTQPKTNNFQLTRGHHEKVLKKIQKKQRNEEKIIVGFFVLYDSGFPAIPLLQKLQYHKEFEVKVILIPEMLRGRENMLEQLNKSYESFKSLTKNIIVAYDEANDSYLDVSAEIDFVCISNPYDCLTHDYFSIAYLSKKDILPFYIDYSFTVSNYSRKIMAQPEFKFFWKMFVPTKDIKREYSKYSTCDNKNVCVTGYCKMDDLINQQPHPSNRKKIILAPHHTVMEWKDGLEISSFLHYSDFFLRLPSIYPNIDFIFRPHPLLTLVLKRSDVWGEEKTEKYLKEMLSNSNVRFSNEQNYLKIFANSDGLIHDCGSFVAEYLFTGKPSCFTCVNKKKIFQQFSPIGKKCLSHHYLTNQEKEILEFIDDVVLQHNDYMYKKRRLFVDKKLRVNYPNVADKIIKIFQQAIC